MTISFHASHCVPGGAHYHATSKLVIFLPFENANVSFDRKKKTKNRQFMIERQRKADKGIKSLIKSCFQLQPQD